MICISWYRELHCQILLTIDFIVEINSYYDIAILYLKHHHDIYANEQPNKEQKLQIISFIRDYEMQLKKSQESHFITARGASYH